MQSTGQYGVTDSPQFLVARAPPHIFSISHDNISLSPPTSHPSQHSHPGHHHHLPHHLAAQHQHQHPHPLPHPHPHQHHYASHLAHQTHASLQAHQQIHQTQSPHAQHAQHLQHAQHSQHALAQLQQQQQQQQPASHPAQDVPQHQLQQVQAQQQAQQQQQEEQQKHAQEQMVQQLGLGDPESPEVPSPIASRPSPMNYSKLMLSAQQDDEALEEEGRSSGGNRWPRAETLALIQIRSEMDANFRDSGVKGPLWDEVSRKLAEQGYNRSGKKCKEKFENIHKYYKKSKDGRAGRQDGKSYRFFAQLDALFGGQQTTTQVETDTAAAVLLIGAGPPLGVSPTEDLNVSAQRPSEVSTAVTLSKSSDDDYDGPGSGLCENQDKKNKKKRKLEGKSGTPKMEQLETMMKSLVDKQEAMQRKFFESMEKIELDRQAKEEAWRRQEVARWTREHELRAQEHASAAQRDTALISFLQKVTGQTIQIPKFSTPVRDPAAPSSRDSEE